MSRLSEMIARLCPNGVEYRKLGEIATDIYRGSGILRNQVTEEGVSCVRYGEIYTTYGIWFEKCVSHTKPEYIQSPKYFEYGDILFAITGESVEEIAKSTAYVGHERCLAGGDIVVMKHKQNPKYIAYALSTHEAQEQKSRGKVKSKVVHSSVPAIKEITIPLPPLEIQREVVEILDNFAQLTAELTAELAKRKKQYEHYRRALLGGVESGEWKVESGGTVRNWPMVKLGEICEVKNGYTPSKKVPEFWTNGDIPWFRLEDIRLNGRVLSDAIQHITTSAVKRSGLFKANSVVLSTTATIGEHALITKPFLMNQQMTALTIKQSVELLPKFLFYLGFDIGKACEGISHMGGGLPIVDNKKLRDIELPLPPLAEQERIVAILDRFDSLCNSLTEGLPAEIALRKKQYEYYRDKLLDFSGELRVES